MTQRSFYPGDEWVYFKIYMAQISADAILTNEIYRCIKSLFRKKMIDKFFFIRYNDPQFHIRLRLHISSITNISAIIVELRKHLKCKIHSNLIHRIIIDTYERELERYGTSLTLDCEDIFYVDSILTLEFLNKQNSEKELILEAIARINYLYKELDLSVSEMKNLSEKMANSFRSEFRIDKPFIIYEKYRDYKSSIKQIIKNNYFEDRFKAFYLVNIANSPMKYDIITSIIHMSVNRLFQDHQRMYEMVLYHFLLKIYKTEIALNTNNDNIVLK